MTYIGGTLYAPIDFDHEAFKDVFDQIAQASFEGLEPSAIGRGSDTSLEVRLKIKTVWIEESTLVAIEKSLDAMFDIAITIEAIGPEQLMPKLGYNNVLAAIVAGFLSSRQKTQDLEQERIERDVEKARIRNMPTDELLALQYPEEYQRRLEYEWRLSDAGAGDGSPDWFAG